MDPERLTYGFYFAIRSMRKIFKMLELASDFGKTGTLFQEVLTFSLKDPMFKIAYSMNFLF